MQMHAMALALAAGLLIHSGAGAQTVYKWVDAEGVTHYSEAPPRGEQPAEQVALSALEPVTTAPGDYQSILAQARVLEAARVARERARSERLAQQRETAWQEAQRAEALARAAWLERQQAHPPAIIVGPHAPRGWLAPSRGHAHKPRGHAQKSRLDHPRHDFGHRSTHDAPLHGQRRARNPHLQERPQWKRDLPHRSGRHGRTDPGHGGVSFGFRGSSQIRGD